MGKISLCKAMKVKDKDWICLRQIQRDPEFPPNKLDKVFFFLNMRKLSSSRYHQMYDEVGFESLASRYQLPRCHFHRYLQVRNYLNKNIKITTLKELHPFIGQILRRKYKKM